MDVDDILDWCDEHRNDMVRCTFGRYGTSVTWDGLLSATIVQSELWITVGRTLISIPTDKVVGGSSSYEVDGEPFEKLCVTDGHLTFGILWGI